MMKEKIIEIIDASLIFRRKLTIYQEDKYIALNKLTFDIYKGEVLGIIGRNGAGKSSTLKLLSGILRPDSGKIIHHTRKICLMALQAGFDPNLTGRDNLIMSGMFLGYSKEKIRDIMPEIHEFSELHDFFYRPVKTYSSGMRARLGFSLAMHLSPDVLLVDEVLGVGDVSFKEKANAAIEEKLLSNMTVVIVSHSEAQIRKLADRVVWIDGGKVRKVGKPKDILPEYNLNVVFSNQHLQLKYWEKNALFEVKFERVQQKNETYDFSIIIISNNNREISKPYILSGSEKILLELGMLTPKFKEIYPDNPFSGRSRFLAKNVNINNNLEIYYTDAKDGITNILSLKLEQI